MERVGYILKMYPRFSETFVLNELLELERQGVELHVFSLKTPDDGIFHADVSRLRARVTYLPDSPLLRWRAFPTAHAIACRRKPGRYLHGLAAALARRRMATLKHFAAAGYIASLAPELHISHVHAHFASGAAAVALHLHRLTGLPYSFTAHAKDIYRHSVDRDELANKLRRARFAVTISDYNLRQLSSLANDARLVRIYNGLDLGQFSPNGVRPQLPPLLLAVGRVIEKKGFEHLIRACAALRRSAYDFRCRIVGKGEELPRLQHLVSELGLDGFVELPGPLPREELLDLYRRASVVVAPCVVGSDGNRDGLPTVLIEAMALGVPVVSTAVTGIPELVEHGRTGLLVPERDPRALAEAIRTVVADRDLAGTLSAAARDRIEERFDLRRNVATLRELLEEVGR